MSDNDEKKERVLHTRISETLDQELRDKASSLGVSVSNLVRNILTNTFDLVEDIARDSASVARSARGEAKPAAAAPAAATAAPGRVIGWQRLILELNAICERCNDILRKGGEAAVGVTDTGAGKPIICIACLENSSHDDHQ
jgi:hypothetical protein